MHKVTEPASSDTQVAQTQSQARERAKRKLAKRDREDAFSITKSSLVVAAGLLALSSEQDGVSLRTVGQVIRLLAEVDGLLERFRPKGILFVSSWTGRARAIGRGRPR